MIFRFLLLFGWVFIFSCVQWQSLKAQFDVTSEEKKLIEEIKPYDGERWDRSLKLGANFALASSNDVVGQTDGESITIGAQILATLNYYFNGHSFKNKAEISEAFSKNPSLDPFVKSNDILHLETLYSYSPKKVRWLGPFARIQVDTTLLEGRDIRNDPVTYSISRLDGTSDQIVNDQLRLTDPLQPYRLRETVGAFINPLAKTYLDIDAKMGFTANETIARGQLALDNNADTPEVEIKELDNVFQGGPSFGVEVQGKFQEGKISYSAKAETMLPLLNNDKTDRNLKELLNVLIEAGLTVKAFSWMSLDYKLKVVREPQIVDQFQIQNNLVINLSYLLSSSSEDEKKKNN